MSMTMLQVETVPRRTSQGVVRMRAVGEVDGANASLLGQALTAAAMSGLAERNWTWPSDILDCAAMRMLQRAADTAGGRRGS